MPCTYLPVLSMVTTTRIYFLGFLTLSFVKHFAGAFCVSQLVSVGLLNFADISIDGYGGLYFSAQEPMHCATDNALQYMVPNKTDLQESKPIQVFERVIYFTKARDFQDVTSIIMEIVQRPENWVNVIILSEKLTPTKFSMLEEDLQNETNIATSLSLTSVVIILEEFDSLIPDGGVAVTAIDIYSIKGNVFMEYCQIHLPLTNTELAKIYRRRHFHQLPLRVVAMAHEVANIHQVVYVVDKNNQTKLTYGYEAVVTFYLASALNFTIEAKYGSGFLGNPYDGPPKGMAQQIRNDEADISIANSEMFFERQQYVTFLIPTYESRNYFLVPTVCSIYAFVIQESNSALRNVFLKPFDNQIWICLLLIWGLLGLSLLFMAWLRKHWNLSGGHDHDANIAEESFLWAMGTLCQQGWHICPSSTSMRMIILAGQITGVVCYIAFGAALVSILSADETLIHSADDLVHYRYSFYCDMGIYHSSFAIKSIENLPTNEMLPPGKTISTEQAYDMMTKSGLAFVTLQDIFYPILKALLLQSTDIMEAQLDDRICTKYLHVPVHSAPVQAGMFIKKNSPLQPFLNQKIILMTERGLKRRFFAYYYRKSVVHCPQSQSSADPLELRDVWTSFLLLAVGWIPAWLLFGYECLHSCIKSV